MPNFIWSRDSTNDGSADYNITGTTAVTVFSNLYNENNGLVSWWKFDNDATDSIGNNDGTRYNFSNGWVTGNIDNALEFNETNETFVDCGNDSSLNFGENDFSIEFWINVSDTIVKSFLYKLTNGDYPTSLFIRNPRQRRGISDLRPLNLRMPDIFYFVG